MLLHTALFLALLVPSDHSAPQRGGDTEQEAKKPRRPKPGKDLQANRGAKDERPSEPLRLSFPVKGLSDANVLKAKDALAAITVRAFQCPVCATVQPGEEPCAPCEVDVLPGSFSVLSDVEALVAGNAVTAGLAGNGPVRLSQVLAALKRAGVEVDAGSVALPGPAVLVLDGGAGEASVAAVQDRLAAAKLYGGVEAGFDADSGKVLVRVHGGGRQAPLQRSVAGAILGEGLPRLADVVWGLGDAKQGERPVARSGKAEPDRVRADGGKKKKGKKGRKGEDGRTR